MFASELQGLGRADEDVWTKLEFEYSDQTEGL
jgi:hypothetical protein